MNILWLAANPLEQEDYLDLEEELRDLEDVLQGARYRSQIRITARHAVRRDDLVRYLRTIRPSVLHFSGHGSPYGIAVRDESGASSLLPLSSLRNTLEGRNVRLLFLNACNTEDSSNSLIDVVQTVIGTSDRIDDVAARIFARTFYRTIGDGFTIADAIKDGKDALSLHDFDDVIWHAGDEAIRLVDGDALPTQHRNREVETARALLAGHDSAIAAVHRKRGSFDPADKARVARQLESLDIDHLEFPDAPPSTTTADADTARFVESVTEELNHRSGELVHAFVVGFFGVAADHAPELVPRWFDFRGSVEKIGLVDPSPNVDDRDLLRDLVSVARTRVV